MPRATIWQAGFLLILVASAPVEAQDGSTKLQGKLICGSFSAEPKTSPHWSDDLNIVINNGTITAERIHYPAPQGVVFKGIVAPSGAILMAGAGDIEGHADWNYEFSRQLNKHGTTQLAGKLTATKGLLGYRICTMSF